MSALSVAAGGGCGGAGIVPQDGIVLGNDRSCAGSTLVRLLPPSNVGSRKMPTDYPIYGAAALRSISAEGLAKKVAAYLVGLPPENVVAVSYSQVPFLHRALVAYIAEPAAS
jgi:hypothetical protein